MLMDLILIDIKWLVLLVLCQQNWLRSYFGTPGKRAYWLKLAWGGGIVCKHIVVKNKRNGSKLGLSSKNFCSWTFPDVRDLTWYDYGGLLGHCSKDSRLTFQDVHEVLNLCWDHSTKRGGVWSEFFYENLQVIWNSDKKVTVWNWLISM